MVTVSIILKWIGKSFTSLISRFMFVDAKAVPIPFQGEYLYEQENQIRE